LKPLGGSGGALEDSLLSALSGAPDRSRKLTGGPGVGGSAAARQLRLDGRDVALQLLDRARLPQAEPSQLFQEPLPGVRRQRLLPHGRFEHRLESAASLADLLLPASLAFSLAGRLRLASQPLARGGEKLCLLLEKNRALLGGELSRRLWSGTLPLAWRARTALAGLDLALKQRQLLLLRGVALRPSGQLRSPLPLPAIEGTKPRSEASRLSGSLAFCRLFSLTAD
jgi:hypothetical protein